MLNHKTGLVIIDMQYGFEAAKNRRTIKNVVIEVKRAVKKRIPIFFLEFSGYRETIKRIKKAVGTYQSVYYVQKRTDDGAAELMKCVSGKKISIKKFRVCGVNTCCCVARTVETLINRYDKEITMIDKGCNCLTSFCDHKHIPNIDDETKTAVIFQHDNVKIVMA